MCLVVVWPYTGNECRWLLTFLFFTLSIYFCTREQILESIKFLNWWHWLNNSRLSQGKFYMVFSSFCWGWQRLQSLEHRQPASEFQLDSNWSLSRTIPGSAEHAWDIPLSSSTTLHRSATRMEFSIFFLSLSVFAFSPMQHIISSCCNMKNIDPESHVGREKRMGERISHF